MHVVDPTSFWEGVVVGVCFALMAGMVLVFDNIIRPKH